MKSLRNKVIMSAIVLVFAVIATIGSTYAWFTVSNTVTVNSITIDVQSQESLLIKLWDTGDPAIEDGTDYDSATYNWTLDDFSSTVSIGDSTAYAGYAGWDLLPVTALTGETAGATDYNAIDITSLRALTDNELATRPLSAAQDGNASGYFLEFSFWLLRPAGGTLDDVVFNYSLSGTYADAMHIGIIGENDSDVDTNHLFGPGLDYGYAWTLSDAGYNGDATDSVVNWSGGDSSINTALTALTRTAGTTDAADTVTLLTTADAPELITVRIWVEGWDADCDNAVMGATFNLGMTFHLV